jgi:hypothetical protein
VVACPSGAGNPFAHLEKAVHADRSVVDQIRGLQEKQRILMKILHFAAPFYAAMTYRNTATASGHYAINPHQVPSLSYYTLSIPWNTELLIRLSTEFSSRLHFDNSEYLQ